MRALQASLNRLFQPQRPMEAGTARSARAAAKALARDVGIDLVTYLDPDSRRLVGITVWPPVALAAPDPYESDHEAPDWIAALVRVQAYATLVRSRGRV